MGGGAELDFEMSGPQRWLWQNFAQPFWQNLSSGNMPDIWQRPDSSMLRPQEGWWQGLDSDVKAGVYEPFKETSRQMLEVMGSRGQTGGASTANTGAAGAAMGQYWGQASPQIAMTGWNMYQPSMMAEYNTQLAQNQAGYQQQMMPYGMLGNATQMAMPYPTVSQSSGFGDYAMGLGGPLLAGLGMGAFGNPFSGLMSMFFPGGLFGGQGGSLG